MKIITTRELQDILKLNNRQTKALVRTQGFPSFKIGREYRIDEDALAEWIKSKPYIKLDYSKC